MNSDKAEEYKVYSSRWLMLGLFCVLNMSNAVLWVTFAPITDISSDYFGGASTTSINMLALIFQIVYAPGTLVGVLATKKYGLRDTLIFGGVLNTLGALIRYIATLCRTQAGSWGAYTLMMVGQFCGALAQPIYVNLPATMAADWFAVDERDIATTIAALFNPLGAAIGQVLPPMLVTQSEDDDNGYVHGMSSLMLAETIVCLVPLLLAVVWFKSKPPTPPSRSAKLKDSLLEEEVEHQHHIHDHSATSLPPTLPISKSSNTIDSVPLSDAHRNSIGEPVRKLSMAEDGVAFSSADLEAVKLEFESLMANKDYVILLVAFSIGLGMFNAYLTLIYQIIEPHGYSNDDAGNFAAVLILFGLIGAGITGAILDATHLYRQVLKLGFISCTLALMFFSCMLYSNNTIMMYVSFGLLGLFMLPMLPAVVENCAECTYPIQEDLSVGLLFIGGNIVGIPFVLILQYLVTLKSWGPAPFSISNTFVVSLVFIATTILLYYNGEYKRLKMEKGVNKDFDDGLLFESNYDEGTMRDPLINASIGGVKHEPMHSNMEDEDYDSNSNSNISARCSSLATGSRVDPSYLRSSQSTNASLSIHNKNLTNITPTSNVPVLPNENPNNL